MIAVAKRFVLGLHAPAEGNQRTACQTELTAFRIDNREIAFYTYGAVAHDHDLCHGTIVANVPAYFGGTGFCVGF
jgi:hypothetical protein